MMSRPAPVAEYVAIVGESPIWSPDEQALYWIDGLRPHLMRLDHGTGAVRIRALPYRPGCIARLPDGRLLIGYKKGIGAFDFESGANTVLPAGGVDFGDVSFNDGACDRRGRFWIGTRHREASAPKGALYRIGTDMTTDRMMDGLIVSNGIAFSPDGGTMYHTDSRPGRIDAYDYDQDSGTPGRRRVLLDYAGRGFRPDGCTVDAEGFLWVAEIDGARISRYTPSGALERSIPLPVRKPSSVAFGGPEMTMLYITTISFGLTPEQRAAEPWAGMLLAMETGIRGLPEPVFRGTGK
jgi:sugar lactone lactonase YvrE